MFEIQFEYISKDKIKEKIEEQKEELKRYDKNEDSERGEFNNYEWTEYIIKILQELLEKEK